VENPAQRSALAVELLGKQGPRMLEVADNMQRMKEQTERLGLALSQVDAAAIEQANDAVSELGFVFSDILQKAAAQLAPYLTAIAKYIKDSVLEGDNLGKAFVEKVVPAIKAAAQAFGIFVSIVIAGKVVAVIMSAVTALAAMYAMIQKASAGMAIFNATANKNPLVKILTVLLAIGGSAAAIYAVNDAFEELDEEVKKILADLEKQQTALENVGDTANNVVTPITKQRDLIKESVGEYLKLNQEFSKSFALQTRLLGLRDDERMAVETIYKFHDQYQQSVEKLQKQLEQSNDAEEKRKINAALQQINEEYRTQLPLVQQLVAERQKELKVVEGIKNLEKAQESTKLYIDRVVDGVKAAQEGLNNLTLSNLDREIVDIKTKLQRDLQNEVKKLQALMNDTNAEEIAKQIDSITKATADAIDQQEKLARKSAEHQRTFAYGWQRAFRQYVDEATNAARRAENIFKKLTTGMEDLIVNFAKTGKFEWKQFVASMLEELLRAEIQTIFASMLGSMKGGMGTGAGGGSMLGGLGSLVGGGLETVTRGIGGIFGSEKGDGGFWDSISSGIGKLFGTGGGGGSGSGSGKSPNDPLYVFDVAGGGQGGGILGGAGQPGQQGGGMFSTIGGALGKAWEGIKSVGTSIGGALGSVWEGVKNVGGSLMTGIGSAVSSIGSVVSGFGSSIGSSIGGIVNTVSSLGSSLFSGISNFFGGFFANGGTLGAGKWGIAGENGPEIISGPATVTPMTGTNVTYNINAVDAMSFKQLLAQDPSFIYALTMQGSKGVPTRR
jgi:lambda family phage tail tape measure protein